MILMIKVSVEKQPVLTIRGVVFSALFAALIVILSLFQIHLGFSPVPITLGNLGVMLAGALLGARYGFFSTFLVVALTAVGLPLLDGAGGLGVILGPSGGYVWMWPIDALLTGWFVAHARTGWLGWVQTFLAIEVFGSLLCYVTGVPWLAHVAHLSFAKAMLLGCYPYLPGDALKAAVATAIVITLRRVYPTNRLTASGRSTLVKIAE